MTEDEWRAVRDPRPMLEYIRETASRRKLRLFAVACCRRFSHLIPTDAARHAVDLSEAAADGRAKFADLAAARRAVPIEEPWTVAQWASNCTHFAAGRAAWHAAREACSTAGSLCVEVGLVPHLPDHYSADLLRCIFPNPFRPTRFSRTWVSSTVESLGRQMYETRDFSAAPILADALEDLGCDSVELLDHLRGPGPHARGCHCVDLVLGFE